MEICKNLCIEPAPFDYQSNYIISWNVDPAIIDLGSSYINIPMAINETYPIVERGGSYVGAVSNVSLGAGSNSATSLSTANIKSIRLKLNGEEIVYTPDINRLLASLDVFDYDVAQERMQEYFSGNSQTYPSGLQAGTAINYSVFRELVNVGSTPSQKFTPTIKVPLKKLLGGLADEVRDLRDYKSIEIVCELDNNALFANAIENNPKFGGPSFDGEENDLPWGIDIPGGKTPNANTWTSTDVISIADFPFGVGDTVDFTVTNGSVIQNIAQNGGGGIVLTLSQNAVAGDVNLLGTSVGKCKQFKLTNTTEINVLNQYPLGSPVMFLGAGDIFSATSTSIVSVTNNGNDALVLLSVGLGATIDADTMIAYPLSLSYNGAPGNGANLPDNLDTTDNYSELTFPLWVGQPVILIATAGVSPMSTVISKIDYNGGKARLTFSPKVTASAGGNVANLFVIPQKAESLAISYPERWELVQYRMLNMGKNLDKSLFNPNFKKWRFDADTIQVLPTYQIYEKTFILENLTSCVVICLCEQNGLTSDIGELASYRLRLDGVDTTSRQILLSGDPSYKYERLLNGFQYLSENLGALSVNPAQNPLAQDGNRYVIIQDLVVDGKEHKLTVSLVNGGTSDYSGRNIRIYKNIISQLPQLN